MNNVQPTTAARRVKPARQVEARFLDTPYPDGRQLLLVRAKGRDFYYLAGRILGDDGNLLGYRLTKPDGTSYCIDLTCEQPTCECLGFLRWQKPCRHIQAVCLVSVSPDLFAGASYKPGPNSDLAF
jgi:hypothetical protein